MSRVYSLATLTNENKIIMTNHENDNAIDESESTKEVDAVLLLRLRQLGDRGLCAIMGVLNKDTE